MPLHSRRRGREQLRRQRQPTPIPAEAKLTGHLQRTATAAMLSACLLTSTFHCWDHHAQMQDCLQPAHREDMGDGDSHEVPSFTGRVWLAAAAQLPKVRLCSTIVTSTVQRLADSE